MWFNQYPYINVNDLNLDFLLKAIRDIKYEVENFVNINAIKYANPIQWSITRQYEKNTIVIDPVSGVAYISVAPVPAGVALTRDEYWTVVFDLGVFITRAAKNFTNRYEADTTLTATFSTPAGAWLVWGDTLYVADVNITAGDSYVVGSNIHHITIEEVKNTIYATFNAIIGDLNDLNTTDKTSIVIAINEVISYIGALADLTTSDKSDIVSAINELVTNIGALSERVDDIYYNFVTPEMFGAVGDGVTDDTDAVREALTHEYVIMNNSYLLTSQIRINNPVTVISKGGEVVANVAFPAVGYSAGSFFFITSDNVSISGLTIKGNFSGNDGMYGIEISRAKYVNIANVHFDLPLSADLLNVNHCDGVHIAGQSEYINVSNCYGTTGDDCIALNTPESFQGSIKHVTINNCNFHTSIGIRLYSNDNLYTIEDVHISNCLIDSELHDVVRILNSGSTGGDSGADKCHVDGLYIDNVNGTVHNTLRQYHHLLYAVYANIKDLHVKNCRLTYAETPASTHYLFYLNNTITRCTEIDNIIENVTANCGFILVLDSVTYVTEFKNIDFASAGSFFMYSNGDNEKIIFKNVILRDAESLLKLDGGNTTIVDISDCYFYATTNIAQINGDLTCLLIDNIIDDSTSVGVLVQSTQTSLTMAFSDYLNRNFINNVFNSAGTVGNVRYKCGVVTTNAPTVAKIGDSYVSAAHPSTYNGIKVYNGSTWQTVSAS